jgi:hypothetical protein
MILVGIPRVLPWRWNSEASLKDAKYWVAKTKKNIASETKEVAKNQKTKYL